MNIKNYTSSVPVHLTVSRIEQLLCEAGVLGVNKDYDNGSLSALSFRITAPSGKVISIRLPADSSAVFETMKKEVSRPREGTMDRIKLQSERTAWKLMEDWIRVQISLIQMQKVDALQVFMPYIWDGTQSFYHAIKAGGFKALPAPRAES